MTEPALQPREIQMDALPAQYGFWNDCRDQWWLALVGPLGTGKTRALLMKDMILRLVNWDHRRKIDPYAKRALPSMLVEPTFGMVRDILVPTVEEFFQEELDLDITVRSAGSRPDIQWPPAMGGGRTMLRSGENPNRLAGSNLSHVGFDEPGQMKHDAITKASARARHKAAIARQRFFTGSPEGINHFSETFDFPDTAAGYCTYWAREWHPDMAFYPGELRKAFRHDLSQLEAYLEGRFCPMFTGRCYTSYDPDVNLDRAVAYDPKLPLWLTADFNVDHMRWLLCQETPREFRVLEEIAPGPGADIPRCAREVVRRYGQKPGFSQTEFGQLHRHPLDLYVTGDSTGNARNVHTATSCYQLMIQELTPAFRALSLQLPSDGNPPHRSRVDTVNWHLRGDGGRATLIHPDCVELRADLNMEHWKPGKPEIAQATSGIEAARTHAAAAFGYWLWRLAPVLAPSQLLPLPTGPEHQFTRTIRSRQL